jgi:hypothetical protein
MKKIELFANNIKIPFGEKISLKFFNPLFNDFGSHSFPISFSPKLPLVNKAFGFPNSQEVLNSGYIPARIKSSIIDLVGSWQISKSNRTTIEAYYKGSSGDFYSLIKEVYLQDIDYGGVKWPAGEAAPWGQLVSHMNTMMETSYPDSEYVAFSAYMPNAESTGMEGDLRFVNPLEYVGEETGEPTFSSGVYGNFSVYLFVGTIIDYIFSNYGYKINANIFSRNSDLKKTVIFHNFNIHAPAQSEYSNLARIDYKRLVPHRKCGDFLKAVSSRFNVGFFINEREKSVDIRSFDEIIAAGPAPEISGMKNKNTENGRITGVNFPHFATDEWNDHSYVSKETELADPIVVDKYRDILPATREHGDIIFVTSEQTYYTIEYSEDLAANEAIHTCPDQLPYYEGDASVEYEQTSGAPAMYTETKNLDFAMEGDPPPMGNTEVDYLLPRCDLVRNGYELPFTDFPIMFLFARGIQNCYVVLEEGAPVYRYPMGSSDVYDAEGTKITDANLAIKWDGEYGLIEKFWKNRINWEQNLKKKITTGLLGKDLLALIDMGQVKRIDNNNYLVNTLEIELSDKTTRIIEAELFRL